MNSAIELLMQGKPSVWLRPQREGAAVNRSPLTSDELQDAQARLVRFAPVLSALFPQNGWSGTIQSELLNYPDKGNRSVLVKADHALPITGSVKARGGVYELLCHIEDVAVELGIWRTGLPLGVLLTDESRIAFSARRVVVASTGNLGFSVGLVARAFGLSAEIHMSQDAKAWKKDRLIRLGAEVIEHPTDYTDAVAQARRSANQPGSYFIDDEHSRRLFVGYATAGRELADQLHSRGIEISDRAPLIVYLPCGVGGAPGGITAGLKMIFGEHVKAVFVEPVASACMFAALAVGAGAPVSVYELGLDNQTIADGLAVPMVSSLVLDAIGQSIDAVVTVTDEAMLESLRIGFKEAALRLEPSGASGFAAIDPFMRALSAAGLNREADTAPIHVVWTTGGALLPDLEFQTLLQSAN